MATTLAASCPSPPLLRPMSLLPRLRLGLSLPLRRRALTAVAAAVRQDAATWTQAPLSLVAPASADASLFHVSVDVSDAPDLAVSYTLPGQYLQLRVPASEKPSFLAIASPPSFASSRGEFQFLVKRVPGSTADLLCELGRGDVVELSAVMGKGFQVERISPPDAFPAVLIFSTGSGIRWGSDPFRASSNFYFKPQGTVPVGCISHPKDSKSIAITDRFKDWESTGVRVIPVLSQPDEKWSGERGYVQTAFSRTKEILNPLLTGAVLCGHKQMAEDSPNDRALDCSPQPSQILQTADLGTQYASIGKRVAVCKHRNPAEFGGEQTGLTATPGTTLTHPAANPLDKATLALVLHDSSLCALVHMEACGEDLGPRTRTETACKPKHTSGQSFWGSDGEWGQIKIKKNAW
ncbi:fruit protein [Musa troglodytarum]|uniref:Fruit protein n=1 Tax=Musa troglodytarum TaxID=320322 RepID=A0A9E7I556_9LILI|nr:fruit protein [Musa troglodytarum]